MSLKATSWAWEIPTKDIGMTNKFVLLAFAVARHEWRDAVVILAGAMVNGAMAVPG